ncbi:DUF1592 domain-containing protein [Rubritalea spongiae]|uniref:DUF1592 domain-containing protein n=1 Tax=Rubritalea spongiae TaxID=430797 RepID=A0ABW5E2I3_9BACT
MPFFFKNIRIIFCAIAACTLQAAESPTATISQQHTVPFLKKYCIDCHGPKKQKGDFRVDTLHWTITNDTAAQEWQDILDVLNAGEMPPEDRAQPRNEEFKNVLASLSKDLHIARKTLASTGGKNIIRRINKREYAQTIKHLFGLNIEADLIPDDIRSEHFDTAGRDQYFDGALLEQYMRIGTAIAKEGFKWSGEPYADPETIRKEADLKDPEVTDSSLPMYDSGQYLYRGSRTSRYVEIPHGEDPRASYLYRVRGGAIDHDIPVRNFVAVSTPTGIFSHHTQIASLIGFTGTPEEPSAAELNLPRTTLGTDVADQKTKIRLYEPLPRGITNPGRWYPIYLKHMGAPVESNIWIDWVELEGPFYQSKYNIFGDLISEDGQNLAKTNTVGEFLEKFCFEAFRRVNPGLEYLNNLENYFKSRMEEGLDYEDAMSETIGLVLSSPGFLYLEENNFAQSQHLSQRAFATRLSYFLWSAPPDEELYKVADSRKLFQPAELRKQVTRMLADPRAEAFYHGFMSQWADLDRLEGISVNWEKFGPFSRANEFASYQEPIEFFKVLVKENLGVDQLIDSDFVVINSYLADFYGIKGNKTTSQFEKIPISKSTQRGGLITQSAFLTIGSSGDRTSPVIRGTLIMEKLLNDPPPPPPPNVPELEAASTKPLSNREMVELHRNQKVCASCHDKIDPIGFGLENFNPIGRWRETEPVGSDQVDIDSSAKLVSGMRFNGLAELKQLLQTQKHRLARNLIDSLTSYGIGRPVEFSDEEEMLKVLEYAKTTDYKLQDLIYLVANSRTFRSK